MSVLLFRPLFRLVLEVVTFFANATLTKNRPVSLCSHPVEDLALLRGFDFNTAHTVAFLLFLFGSSRKIPIHAMLANRVMFLLPEALLISKSSLTNC